MGLRKCCGMGVCNCLVTSLKLVSPRSACFTVRHRAEIRLQCKHLRNDRPPTAADRRPPPTAAVFGVALFAQDVALQAFADAHRTTLIMLTNSPEGDGSRCVASTCVTDIRFLDTVLRGGSGGASDSQISPASDSQISRGRGGRGVIPPLFLKFFVFTFVC